MKRITFFTIMFLTSIFLLGCNKHKKVYLFEDSLNNYQSININLTEFQEPPLIYISKNYKCKLLNNLLILYKNENEYSTINFIGNFEISPLGHADIFEKNDTIIFLTRNENSLYINYFTPEQKYDYETFSKIDNQDIIHLFVDSNIYITKTNTIDRKTEIFKKSPLKNDFEKINEITYKLTECINFLYDDANNFVIQDYSQKYINTFFSYNTESDIVPYKNKRNFLLGNNYYSTIDTNSSNNVCFFKSDDEIKLRSLKLKWQSGLTILEFPYNNCHICIDTLNITDGKAKITNNLSGYDAHSYNICCYNHNNTCYYLLYDEHEDEKYSFPKLIMLKITPDDKIEYGIMKDFHVLAIYQYSNYIVFKNEEQTLYYEMK